ncbi:MAG: hypothetical protein HY080_00285 [Gammaproteobacteria bacterium]|nr:hypothetical protein [Gammaproteobacteria bacterium]
MKNLELLLVCLFLAGCGENSAIIPIPDQNTGQPTSVQFVTEVKNAAISELSIQYFPKYQPIAVHDISQQLKHTPDNPQVYLAELPKLEPDTYRVLVRMVYYQQLAGINLLRYTRVYTRDFHVYAPLSHDCFTFDNGPRDSLGWTTTPVYLDARDQPVTASGCPGVLYANHNWPTALTDTTNGGSLFIPVSDKCFPSTSPTASQPGNWHFTLSSPSLRNLPAWQNLKAVQLRVATKAINVDIRPEIVYSDGLPIDNQPGEPIRYTTYRGSWRVIEHPVNLPKGAKVSQLNLYITGIPETTVSKDVDAIVIDGICPIK